jgi:hypothetical protein
MRLSQDAIRRLLTKEETEFIEGLAEGRIESITPTRLRQKLQRARRLRDKYRDLARRQGGEMRGKAKPRSTRPARSNANTLRKVQVFEWAIDRITGHLEAPAGGAAEGDERWEPEAKGDASDYTVEAIQPRVVEVLTGTEAVSFGDLWAEMPDVPVHMLRKALWSLSEAGAVDLTDDAGVALATEKDVAEEVEVEVEIDRPAPFIEPPGRGPGGRPGKATPGGAGHHPNVRIHSHLRASGRRGQSRRDRRG